VNALVISPLAKGLFHRAIGQSGAMFSSEIGLGQTLDAAENSGLKFCEALKVKTLEELRKIPANELMKAGGRASYSIDGYVLPEVIPTFEAGQQNDVPLISGWNADDGVSFGPLPSAEKFKADAEKKYGTMAPEFFRLFPANTEEEAGKSQKMLNVLTFGWLNYRWASMQTKTGKNKAFLYYFTHVPPGEPNYGAFHSAEFGYALKTLKYWNKPFVSWDHQLAEIMSSYWVNFAATGNPNGSGLPEWPAFQTEDIKVMQFGEKAEAIDLPFEKQLKFLDRYQEANRN
jgi:para-nitrobenzyl esterase